MMVKAEIQIFLPREVVYRMPGKDWSLIRVQTRKQLDILLAIVERDGGEFLSSDADSTVMLSTMRAKREI
jgi:hypothetical protein